MKTAKELIKEFKNNVDSYVPAQYALRNKNSMNDFLDNEWRHAIEDDCDILFKSLFPNYRLYRQFRKEFLELVG